MEVAFLGLQMNEILVLWFLPVAEEDAKYSRTKLL